MNIHVYMNIRKYLE